LSEKRTKRILGERLALGNKETLGIGEVHGSHMNGGETTADIAQTGCGTIAEVGKKLNAERGGARQDVTLAQRREPRKRSDKG